MKQKVFVDGQHGTTGLEIHKRLKNHDKVELINIDFEERRNIETRKKLINSADIVFLCLPDEGSREAVSLITNPDVRVIDASVAHRVEEGWTYGIPEINKEQRINIKKSKRVSVPGCHATGFLLLVAPLVAKGIIPKDYPISFHSITGYSGGGKRMIADYENNKDSALYKVPRPYALGLYHKHLPEMQKYSGLNYTPIFMPIVCDYYKGMAISVPLFKRYLGDYSIKSIYAYLSKYYKDEKFISTTYYTGDNIPKFFNLSECNNTNKLDIFVYGNDEQVLLISRLDNLGKGASGAAVQNMNIMLGYDEDTGL